MASVRKRKWTASDGEIKTAWVCEYTDRSGDRRRKTFSLKKEADAYRSQVSIDVEQGSHTPDSKTITVNQACDVYIDLSEQRCRRNDRVTEDTLASRKYAIPNHIRPFLGTLKLNKLTAADVQKWVDDMHHHPTNPRSPYVIRVVTQVFRQVLVEAQRRGNVGRNVMADAPPRRPNMPTERVQVFSKTDIRKILDIIVNGDVSRSAKDKGRTGGIVMVAIFTGLRLGEILALGWEHVDFENRIIRVRRSSNRYGKLKATKTEAGVRDVPMPALLAKHLSTWKLSCHPSPEGLVFAGSTGRPVNSSNFHGQGWRALMTVADMLNAKRRPKYHFHAFRHFAASAFIEQGLQPKVIQRLMGHTSIKMTYDRYGHLFPEDKSAGLASDRIEEMLRPAARQECDMEL